MLTSSSFIYCSLILYTLFAVCKQSLQINITILVSELIYEYFQTGMSEKGTIHISMMKTGSVIYFFLEKGGYRIPGSAEKGGYSACTSVLCHIGQYFHITLKNFVYLNLCEGLYLQHIQIGRCTHGCCP